MKHLLANSFGHGSTRVALLLALVLSAFYSPLVAEEPGTSDVSHLLDMRFSTTTFLLNLEKQGLEDNTFTNGLGRDTTLIGNRVNATLYR